MPRFPRCAPHSSPHKGGSHIAGLQILVPRSCVPHSNLFMIGEGLQSSNQRRHTYVQDFVEVGFFTDPSVCIGCKACEVACKEWNQVPDDGFTWTGNSYDNTGHLGASTWRHVLFVEQDRAKGKPNSRIAWPLLKSAISNRAISHGKILFAGSFSPTSASTARTPAALKPARPAPSCGPKSAPSWSRMMSATAAAIASFPVLLA